MSVAIPRLELEQMPADLQDYLGPRVKRLKYLGELFKCAANTPAVLLSFMHFTDALKDSLPDSLTEAAVLTTATMMHNAYERNQHERLSVRLGYGREWVAEVEKLSPDSAVLMSGPERAVQRYVIAAIETRGTNVQAEFDVMAKLVTPGEAVAIVMLVGRYITHALVVNTLQLKPPVPSIFEDGFNGDGGPAKDKQ